MPSQPLNLGVIGLGRHGGKYAHYVSRRLEGARLHAVADVRPGVAKAVAEETGAAKWHGDYRELLADKALDAVVVTTPSRLHGEPVLAAAQAGKAIFCEKPLALDLGECAAMQAAVEKHGVFFQLGLMRRFDSAYVDARRRIDDGLIGTPFLFTSTSRDPFPPAAEYCRPESSGGIFVDMGTHDFDLARWYIGEVKSVFSAGGILAHPELGAVGDADNGFTLLNFANGGLGTVHVSRTGVSGYTALVEVSGAKGVLRIGYDQNAAVAVVTKDGVAREAVPRFSGLYEQAFVSQLQNFVDNLRHDRPPPIGCKDGVAVLKISLAATRSWHSGKVEAVG